MEWSGQLDNSGYKLNDTQKLSKELQTNLKTFISDFNADYKIAFHDGNVTYREYLEMVITEYNNNLCDEKYELIRKQKLTKPSIESMIASLDQQNEALRLISLDMKRIITHPDHRREVLNTKVLFSFARTIIIFKPGVYRESIGLFVNHLLFDKSTLYVLAVSVINRYLVSSIINSFRLVSNSYSSKVSLKLLP